MSTGARPLSPHIQIYRWQIQMVTSILHRATGIALAAGSIVVLLGVLALAAGPDAYAKVQAFGASWIGRILLIGWTWSLAYHLLNGIRHLVQDGGAQFEIREFVRNGWIAVIGSFVLTVIVWAIVFSAGSTP